MKLNKRDWIVAITGLAIGILVAVIILPTGGHDDEHAGHDHSDESQEWTCSMHPQIRQEEPGDCPLCGMDLIPVSDSDGSGTERDPFSFTMSKEAAALANVRTQKVELKSTGRELSLTGKITINERNTSAITAHFGGRIEQLWVNYVGQQVNQGQRLATIYSPELIAAQKELLEAAKTKESHPQIYEAVKEKLKLWNLSEAQILEIENLGEVRTTFDVYANTNGIVKSRNIAQGDYVTRGNKLFDIASLNDVWVFLDAYESDLKWINTGDEITFTVGALPGEEFTSKITYVDPVINPETRTANIRLEMDNRHQKLKPGMFVSAKASSQIEPALQIPVSAIMWTGPRSVVYVKVPGSSSPVFEMREVTLGIRAGDHQVIEAGLEAGDEVVVSGTFAVDAAAQLRGNYSMMHRPVDKQIAVPLDFREELSGLINDYIRVKNALVESDLSLSQQAAKSLTEKSRQIEAAGLSEQAHDIWVEQLATIQKSSETIMGSNSIDAAREAFEHLSESAIEIMERFRPGHDTYFVNYCPMAFDDEGAYWLSEVEKILNPYFGDAMLMCGEITQTFETHQEEQQEQAGHVH